MKLEWRGYKPAGMEKYSTMLTVSGVEFAEVYRVSGSVLVWVMRQLWNDSRGRYDTEEAAKAAAERAVKEWFRAALGEPVIWARFDDAGLCSLHDDDAGEGCEPLYALEADE